MTLGAKLVCSRHAMKAVIHHTLNKLRSRSSLARLENNITSAEGSLYRHISGYKCLEAKQSFPSSA
jgi:hypothetical protein